MKRLPVLALLFLLSIDIQGQNSLGLRFNAHLNRVFDDLENPWQPLSFGGNGAIAWQLKSRWFFQLDLGLSQRRTELVNAGVSHYLSSKYRLLQTEINLLGKYELVSSGPRIMLTGGLATGLALSGRGHTAGWWVGPYSVSYYQKVDFGRFDLRRFQFGPMVGFDIAQKIGSGEMLLDVRLGLFPEERFNSTYGYLRESRLSIGVGYRWNLKRKPN